MKVSDYAYKETNADELRKLEALMVRGLEEGGLGFGLGITYTPGATREEILRLFEVARAQHVPIYVCEAKAPAELWVRSRSVLRTRPGRAPLSTSST